VIYEAGFSMSFCRLLSLVRLLPLYALIPAVTVTAAESVSLSWDSNPEPDIVGYRLYYGTHAGSYAAYIDTKATMATVSNLLEGTTYFFAVTASNGAGGESDFSNEVAYTIPGEAAGFLANVSSRASLQSPDFVLIGGFIIETETPKKVAVRALGPSLSSAGVSGALEDPTLELLDSSGTVVGSSDDWQSGGRDLPGLGLAPGDERESGFTVTLPAGGYSAVVRGKGSAGGVALVEIYDLDANAGRIANISTRSRVGPGDSVLIGGFIIAGTEASRVLARAIGPSLASAGVSAPLADPSLELHDANGSLIFTNDNWRDTQEREIIDSTIAPTNDREAAIIATLTPGAYSAVIRGMNNSTGVALFEIYTLD
jgi:hypothetical protein